MKINLLEIDFSDDEIREYLTKKGYVIEKHTLPSLMYNNTTLHSEYELAMKNDSDICADNEYKKVFRKEVYMNIKNKILYI